MIRVTATLRLAEGASPDRLIEAVQNAAPEIGAAMTDAALSGNSALALLGAFQDRDAAAQAVRSPYVHQTIRPLVEGCARAVEIIRYNQAAVQLQQPRIENSYHRSLMMRILPDADPDLVTEFERELVRMPSFIKSITNSSLSRLDPVGRGEGPAWTHVWEQEFANRADFQGEYVQHAYHWSWADRFGDGQSPYCIMAPELNNLFCPLRQSMLSLGRTG